MTEVTFEKLTDNLQELKQLSLAQHCDKTSSMYLCFVDWYCRNAAAFRAGNRSSISVLDLFLCINVILREINFAKLHN